MKTLIIRRGIVLEQTYRFYEPLNGTRLPDYSKPVDISGFTWAYVVQDDKTGNAYEFSSTITVTPLEGRVDVLLSSAQTATLPPIDDAVTYLKLTDAGGDVRLRGEIAAIVRN